VGGQICARSRTPTTEGWCPTEQNACQAHADLSFLVSTALMSRPNSKQWIEVSLYRCAGVERNCFCGSSDKMSDINHAMESRWRAPGHSANPKRHTNSPMKCKQACKELVPVNTISTPQKTCAACRSAHLNSLKNYPALNSCCTSSRLPLQIASCLLPEHTCPLSMFVILLSDGVRVRQLIQVAAEVGDGQDSDCRQQDHSGRDEEEAAIIS